MISRFKDLEEVIKYKFNSKDLLTRCLTHKSYDENINNDEHNTHEEENNENQNKSK